MIPQAIKGTGPYAQLWSRLKSMEHALGRLEAASKPTDLTPLDEDRLHALYRFVNSELVPSEHEEVPTRESFLAYQNTEFGYSLEEDPRSLLKELPSFQIWATGVAFAFEKQVEKLLHDLAQTLNVKRTDHAIVPISPQELKILREFLTALVMRTETALTSLA
jgi:hypothetical protein